MFLLSLLPTTLLVLDMVISGGEITRKIISYIRDKFTRKPPVTLNTTIINITTTQSEIDAAQETHTKLDFTSEGGDEYKEKFLFAVMFLIDTEKNKKHEIVIMDRQDKKNVNVFREEVEANFLNKNLLINGNSVYVEAIEFGTVILSLKDVVLDNVIIRIDDSVWTPTNYEKYKKGLEEAPPLINLDDDNLPRFTNSWTFTSIIGSEERKIRDHFNKKQA